jgi:hypothetical protein
MVDGDVQNGREKSLYLATIFLGTSPQQACFCLFFSTVNVME